MRGSVWRAEIHALVRSLSSRSQYSSEFPDPLPHVFQTITFRPLSTHPQLQKHGLYVALRRWETIRPLTHAAIPKIKVDNPIVEMDGDEMVRRSRCPAEKPISDSV